MKTYTCTHCSTEFQRYPSTVRNQDMVFCSKACKGKWQKEHLKGEANPNYKDGSWNKESYCNCGSLKDSRAKQCSLCAKRGYPLGHKTITCEDENQIHKAVETSTTFSEAARKLGRSRQWITKYVTELQLNIDHFAPCCNRRIPINKLFVKGTIKRNGTIKKAIIDYKTLEYFCHECGQAANWNKQKLVLELDHINGNPTDNRIENLRFLCPNCHSQMPTSKGKNSKGVKKCRQE